MEEVVGSVTRAVCPADPMARLPVRSRVSCRPHCYQSVSVSCGYQCLAAWATCPPMWGAGDQQTARQWFQYQQTTRLGGSPSPSPTAATAELKCRRDQQHATRLDPVLKIAGHPANTNTSSPFTALIIFILTMETKGFIQFETIINDSVLLNIPMLLGLEIV